jgi:cell division protein FtsB
MEPVPRRPARRRRTFRRRALRRWLAIGAVGVIALLYYRPVRAYIETRHTVAQRSTEVRALRTEHRALERRLAQSDSGTALVRASRRLGLVKPGEQLFIITGISAWRRAQSPR